MLETVYAHFFSSTLLRQKPELSALRTTRPKIFGRMFNHPRRRAGIYQGWRWVSEVCQARIDQSLGHKAGVHFSATLREEEVRFMI
jgi:hypothetical protein